MTEVLDYVSDPWTLEFMRRGLIAAVMVSAVAAVIGCFVILKGMAFIGDALPHASFGGVAAAFVLGANLYLGGAIAAVLTALLIGFVSRRALLKYDTAIGILFVGAFAAGILIISRRTNYTPDLFSFVFGNVLGVSWSDVWTTAVVAAVILVLVVLFYKELLFVTYDPSMAAAAGLPVAAVQYGLLALIGVTTVIGLQTVGIVLVVALIVTPAATAQLLTRRLPAMMAAGAAVGVLSSLAGLYVAYYADVSASAAIVLTATAFFFLAFLFAPGRGLLWQRGFSPAGRV
ncbi:MAG: manganese ABC transporter permease [Chloroflexi bacterium RBG_16_64_32]|nr:MAG: manganese ABC transporter permease [Chloroflexi bacterium RBG_16_64_32]